MSSAKAGQTTSLAGYSQQDAHEFFITTLDLIHRSLTTLPNSLAENERWTRAGLVPNSDTRNCPCFVHRIFQGELRSDVTCLFCGNVTTAIEVMLDVSLEVNPCQEELIAERSLADCLHR